MFADAPDDRPPRQLCDCLSLIEKRIRLNLMSPGPVVFRRAGKHRFGICHVRMFERKLGHTVTRKAGHVVMHGLVRVDETPGHHTRRADLEPLRIGEKLVECWCLGAHQAPALHVVVMMSRIAQVSEPRLSQPPGQCGGQVAAVREARDLGEELPPTGNQVHDVVRAQKGLTAAGDDQT